VLLGAAPLVLVLLLGAFFSWRESQLKAVVAKLEPAANEYDELLNSLGRQRGELKKLQQSNESLVQGLLSVPSSSALLAELARLTPQGIQLKNMRALGSTMTLKGEAFDPAAFLRINAFRLSLQRSPFFQSPARLQRAARQQDAVAFDLTADFQPSESPEIVAELAPLGAVGLAARFQRLEDEGLMP